MLEDWRFRESPYVELGGLTAYAGVPLRMRHESGECVGLGSLCVASATSQDPLDRAQQQTLARLADWIVADIIQCARAKRQRERHRLAELIADAQHNADTDAESVLTILRIAYPDESISLQSARADHIEVEGRYSIFPTELENGLWEDTAYIDEFITSSNHNDPPAEKVIRFISAKCESELGSSLLIVATKDFRRIFDDIDAWFIEACATLLSQRWQKRLLSDAMTVKEKFLRGVSHQLRTPVHGILGAAELLAEDLSFLKKFNSPDSALLQKEILEIELLANLAKSATYLDTITTAGREIMSTVNSMITLNRWAEIAVADRQYALHSISELEGELVKGISGVTSAETRSKPDVFFHYDLPKDCGSLRIDLNLLRDSILPLVVNAIQNTSEGLVTITISVKEDRKTLVIDIEDTGNGIHLDDQQRIFGLYEKVGEHSTGAGLGLPLAAKFASLLHGSIELVTSDIGSGSHFRATFLNVDCLPAPLPLQATASTLKSLPSKCYHLESGLDNAPLSSNLTKFLTCNGFDLSDKPEDCLIIVDHLPDPEQRRTYLSNIPQGQVALCLVPNSEGSGSLDEITNIVYSEGPFTTSTLGHALEEADRLVANMNLLQQELQRPAPEPLSTPADDPTCESPPADECSDSGYGSMAVSPSSHVSVNGSNSIFDMLASSVNQDDITAASKSLTPSSTTSLAGSAKPRALLVDDNIVNLRIMQMYCKKRGLPYCSAADGQQAVQIFAEQQALAAAGKATAIELVLMDLQMPVCDGIEATRQIRELERENEWKSSVLFMVTGQDSQKDREAASSASADDYLVKPVSMKVLDFGVKRYFRAFEAG